MKRFCNLVSLGIKQNGVVKMMNEDELKEMRKKIQEYVDEKGYEDKVEVRKGAIFFENEQGSRGLSISNNMESNIEKIENNI